MRPRKPTVLIWLVLASISAPAQLSKKNQAATCATCHEEQAVPQPATQMAHAMELPAHNAVLSGNPKLTYREGAYSYSVTTKNGHSVYVVNDGTKTVSIPIV